ncbi:hypothetical protein [Hymenobacter sp. BT559]|uniref:hypothetical protein n=1 Tax=Hymenobacter sp. BT559 TaxID=2795729 RepID=UPI001AACE435|nr:hypothetical protein [Hymenobacter sp. BT559]
MFFNLLLFFGGLADQPLRFIKIDKQADSVTYALLFHSSQTVSYTRLQSEWITKKRVSRFGTRTENILSFKLSDQEIFSLSENSFGWSKEQLDHIHEAVIIKG